MKSIIVTPKDGSKPELSQLKHNRMLWLSRLGVGLFILAWLIFTIMPSLESYKLSPEDWIASIESEEHAAALMEQADKAGLFEMSYGSTISAGRAYQGVYQAAQRQILEDIERNGLPEGKQKWELELPDWQFKNQLGGWMRAASDGYVSQHPLLFLFLTLGLGSIGGLIYMIPKFMEPTGIKHDGIYHNPLTRGLCLQWRSMFVIVSIVGMLIYGFYYMNGDMFWPILTAVITLVIVIIVAAGPGGPSRSASPERLNAWLGMAFGIYLMGFYVLLYWAGHHTIAWTIMVDPVSQQLNGGLAGKWFLYGLIYTLVILVMGVRMLAKYRHNKYQLLRTVSVVFFQTAFAFLIPEVLVSLNKPWYDFKNIWPLDYDFFFSWNLDQLQNAGALGMFMLVWGVVLIILGVPLMTYFLGKRWYCSWVCGCGGLAETLGDPWRQLSDKSLKAWRAERWIIHGVLVAAVVMTCLTLYSYFTGTPSLLGIQTGKVQEWYGFLIGAGFAGVVGTGFYPLMGSRVWCRFGCPLAAYLGLVQRFQSKFRITTNGGQCISCGNCSTYCEMGIDVRHYAQRGQDIVRASCVGCGVCAAVCPRGVLRLENAKGDIQHRAKVERTLHIVEGEPITLN